MRPSSAWKARLISAGSDDHKDLNPGNLSSRQQVSPERKRNDNCDKLQLRIEAPIAPLIHIGATSLVQMDFQGGGGW